jgi:hypothetical protein
MKRPTTDKDVAVYGMIRNCSLFLFMILIRSNIRGCRLIYNIKLIVNIFIY